MSEITSDEFKKFRKDYNDSELLEGHASSDPFVQFSIWFDDARKAKAVEPNAMTIATVGTDNQPSARIVLLKELTKEGFVFYTNYLSQKGKELESNNKAALLFYWEELERQVRIEGDVFKVDAEKSEQYFNSRPLDAQLGAVVSQQSSVVASREELEEKLKRYTDGGAEVKIERPEHWGGYIVKPHSFEFWQGRPSRLHDRLKYSYRQDQWQIVRLAP